MDRAVDQTQQTWVAGKVLFRELEVAEHRHQQIVEVVGEASSQLPETFELLHLVNLCERLLALSGALLDPPLELRIGLR